ncbi:DUF3175 domain-containing protein [Burkholderia oklahomensis]|uniref:DUF3175 domain-containing protein n=2 Tax=Burkholderia oklahomensis TaxID=342113 RepID=A0AAI8FQ41_9BURK|nr:DUF3175 domain-containing protein [Burkholderia oklahomensis]AIO68794.1 hypothetical protein DM82_4097 [Burkholderia oklahomensis]AJX34127.1 hypothetical protein BG90_3930 [Burkholderia oklahomensis C6786]AOI40337.1 hypothetical protein WG70_12385 [Burkholderia oklahomensis EO147]AOI49959.1 hypothetical protein WI23_30150 [Burkholderia oklahomensis C6786]KUY53122.1 hypothetical protein WI23_23300 [Burkholderia oklahomensis C6786]
MATRKTPTRKSAPRKTASRPPASGRKRARTAQEKSGRYWSNDVTQHSNALDLEPNIFKSDDPEAIAQSLKRSALDSTRRKGTPLQSAMSMLNFYMNRAGRNLPKARRDTLERVKKKLREAFGRKP